MKGRTMPTFKAMSDTINDYVNTIIAAEEFEDAPTTRYWILKGIQAAWREDSDRSLAKSAYQMVLSTMIIQLMLDPKTDITPPIDS
jgi:hypothetical protein